MAVTMALDHLVVSASDLTGGVDGLEGLLGVPLTGGGKHPRFGTHNRLLSLGAGVYLEVIAIDPKAAAPKGPRWFDLDRFAGPLRLSHWACRTEDLATLMADLGTEGVAEPLSRGKYKWQMMVTDTGRLPFDNLFPALLQWQGTHPADAMEDAGCSLSNLRISHPKALDLKAMLSDHLIDDRIEFVDGLPGLLADIETPHGRVILL